MPKRKKSEEKIQFDPSVQVKNLQAPPCYNQKAPFCRKELCDSWYETCAEEKTDDHFGRSGRECEAVGGA